VSSSDNTTSLPTQSDPAADLAIEQIAEQLTVLDSIAERPLPEHADAYHELHAALQEALAEIEST
jgi:hypothetical protein